jgi:Acetyl-CoA dehydrogenase C-terminal like
VQLLFSILAEEIGAAKLKSELADFAGRLEKATGDLQSSTMWFVQNGMTNPNNAGAGAVSYMHLMGIVTLGLMWLRMASTAQTMLAAGEGDKAFLEAKLVTARFFAERIMPDTGALRRKIEGGAESIMALPVEMFEAA